MKKNILPNNWLEKIESSILLSNHLNFVIQKINFLSNEAWNLTCFIDDKKKEHVLVDFQEYEEQGGASVIRADFYIGFDFKCAVIKRNEDEYSLKIYDKSKSNEYVYLKKDIGVFEEVLNKIQYKDAEEKNIKKDYKK